MKFTGERYLPQVDGWLALQHYHRYYFVINQIDLREKIVLDIACGEGYGCNILSKFSKFVYGVDISNEAIDYAQKTYLNPNTEFIVGSAASIPLDNKSVDVVVSFETIEHHDLHNEMMLEIKRVLKDKGLLIISSPDKGYYEKYFIGYKNEFHVKEMYHEEFLSLINKFFSFNKVFIQNNIIGSIIVGENEICDYKRPIQIEQSSGISKIIEPRFNICIASDSELSFSSSISICTNSYNDVFSIIDEQKKIIENIYKSQTWKMARLFSNLIRKIRS